MLIFHTWRTFYKKGLHQMCSKQSYENCFNWRLVLLKGTFFSNIADFVLLKIIKLQSVLVT